MIGNKYDCGCNKPTCNACSSRTTRTYTSSNNCCTSNTVQAAPTPCCESHEISTVAGICLTPSCNVIASEDEFYLTFSNLDYQIPIDGNIYFYHPAAGRMQIVAFDGVSYRVRLTDNSKAGGLIPQGGCVFIDILTPSDVTDTTKRCLVGKFTVPGIGANETIYIENGSSIPVGSSITFTANGETGTYQVVSFVSASGNTYAYEVQNTGNGHTPGTIIDGGCEGVCTIPIELIQDVDICDLSTANDADTITACKNGSPRALVPTGEGDVITGTADGGWELRKVTNLDCCVVLDGCLKFTDSSLDGITDSVVLRTTVPDCFTNAYDEAVALDQYLAMNINGLNVVVTNYVSGNRTATFQVSDASQVTGLLEFASGTQVCLGDCCDACINGPQITDHKTFGGGDTNFSALYNISASNMLKYGLGGAVAVTDAGGGQLLFTSTSHGMWVGESITVSGTTNYNASYTIVSKTDDTMTVVGAYVSDQAGGTWVADAQRPRHYLLGFEYGTGTSSPGDVVVTELDDTYNQSPGNGPGKPSIEDPLVWRTKICNTSPDGCNQVAEIDYNYEIIFDPIPDGVRCHFEVGHYGFGSKTLEDGTTPNPFDSISTQVASSGYVDGPSSQQANSVLLGTSIGFGGTAQNKVSPFVANNVTNLMTLEKNNCGISIVWLYVQVEVLPGASVSNGTVFNSELDIRQVIKKLNDKRLPMPENDPNQEDFKA